MYHEKTYREEARKRRWLIVAVVALAAVVVAVLVAANAARADARVQGAAALRSSILTAAKQCAAIEGSYPDSLQHLEDDYGLTINHDDYVITYECFADNLMPSVVVVPR